MERNEIVRRLVLREITDDYENVDQQILPSVSRLGERLGMNIQRGEVVTALAGLIHDGFASAYRLSPFEPPLEFKGMPSLEVVEMYFETYFYVTPKGLAAYLADDSQWPFDAEGNPVS